jgi:hypothetical protein
MVGSSGVGAVQVTSASWSPARAVTLVGGPGIAAVAGSAPIVVTVRAMVAVAALKSRQRERDTERLPRGHFDRIKTLARIAEWLSGEMHRSFEMPLHPPDREAEQMSQERSILRQARITWVRGGPRDYLSDRDTRR